MSVTIAMSRASRVALALFLACLGTIVQAADVRAWLDRNAMQLGETVTLNVEVAGDTQVPQPDFGALRADFEVLGTQSSTSVNIVNGQTSSKLLWAVGLQPRHAGTLTIAPLDIAGARTAPIVLNVQPASATGNGKAGDDLYIDISVDARAPYVQQQVRYNVKLYFALNFSDGGLDEPQADGMAVHKLGQDVYYSAEVGGRRYRVWERRYALTPQKSGTLTLPPLNFRGHAIDPADINSFFNRGRPVAARSEAVTLDVRPRPGSSGSDAWLPARAVELTAQGIDANAKGRVGEPLTLTLHLKAQGLGFDQLPDLKLPPIDGADVYPDKTTTQNRDDGEWLYGERERKFAIVPNRPGTLTLPALNLAWWDTAHDRAETAEIASLAIPVEPAAATGAAFATAPLNGSGVAAAKNEENVPTMGTLDGADGVETILWRRMAFFAFSLWAATLLAWIVWLVKQRRPALSPAAGTPLPSMSAGFADLRGALERRDWPASARTLLAWARGARPDLRSLGELAAALADPTQSAAVRELDRACYGGGPSEDLTTRVTAAFKSGLQLAKPRSASASGPLPALYPDQR